MARISYLTDEHVPSAVAKGLRARGIEAFTLAEKGQLGSADLSLLTFAATEGRVLITADPDHLRLHSAGVSDAGIVFAPSDASIGAIIGGAMLIAEVLTSEEMMNHVEFL